MKNYFQFILYKCNDILQFDVYIKDLLFSNDNFQKTISQRKQFAAIFKNQGELTSYVL